MKQLKKILAAVLVLAVLLTGLCLDVPTILAIENDGTDTTISDELPADSNTEPDVDTDVEDSESMPADVPDSADDASTDTNSIGDTDLVPVTDIDDLMPEPTTESDDNSGVIGGIGDADTSNQGVITLTADTTLVSGNTYFMGSNGYDCTISSPGSYTIEGVKYTAQNPSSGRIIINAGAGTVNLTLRHVVIHGSESENANVLDINRNGELQNQAITNIYVDGSSEIHALGSSNSPVSITGGCSEVNFYDTDGSATDSDYLTCSVSNNALASTGAGIRIYKDNSTNPPRLNFNMGSGRIYAYSGYNGGAAIGTSSGEIGYSSITINSGTIIATGRTKTGCTQGGAGIGSGYNANYNAYITINKGAHVEATGALASAGIGAGQNGKFTSTIKVDGGDGSAQTVVIAKGGTGGAGIGGSSSGKCKDIQLLGGGLSINSYAGTNAAAIGAGSGATSTSNDNITIENTTAVRSTVFAYADKDANNNATGGGSAIGHYSTSTTAIGTIKISGPVNVTAHSNSYSATIGCYSGCKSISIASNAYGSPDIEAINTNGPAIGAYNNTLQSLTISGGNVTAVSGSNGAAIGTYVGNIDNITVSGGTINATGGSNCPGIGITNGFYTGNMTFSGGNITATGGNNAAGIGAGSGFAGTNTINISGATIQKAQGGENGAGIGGGYGSSTLNVNISGGTITEARGGVNAPGIGGNSAGDSNCVSVTIENGIVNAYGGDNAAGIGTGINAYRYQILLTGGTISATGGKKAAGIGTNSTVSTTANYSGSWIKLCGGTITANGGVAGCGIGANGGNYGTENNIYIYGGTITAIGGDPDTDSDDNGGAGIGFGAHYNSSNATDYGVYFLAPSECTDTELAANTKHALVTAIGGTNAPGIGTGCSIQKITNIVIKAGVINAQGKGNAPGIGGGVLSNNAIKVYGGNLQAQSGGNCTYLTGSAASAVTPINQYSESVYPCQIIGVHNTDGTHMHYSKLPQNAANSLKFAYSTSDIRTKYYGGSTCDAAYDAPYTTKNGDSTTGDLYLWLPASTSTRPTVGINGFVYTLDADTMTGNVNSNTLNLFLLISKLVLGNGGINVRTYMGTKPYSGLSYLDSNLYCVGQRTINYNVDSLTPPTGYRFSSYTTSTGLTASNTNASTGASTFGYSSVPGSTSTPVLTVNWTAQIYNITLDLGGTTTNFGRWCTADGTTYNRSYTQSREYSTSFNPRNIPMRIGYNFTGYTKVSGPGTLYFDNNNTNYPPYVVNDLSEQAGAYRRYTFNGKGNQFAYLPVMWANLTNGNTYELSYWIRTEGLSAGGTLQVSYRYGDLAGNTLGAKSFTGSDFGWKKVSIEFTSNGTYTQYVQLFCNEAIQNSIKIDIKNMVIKDITAGAVVAQSSKFLVGAGDATIAAQWQTQSYSINYELNGGTATGSNPNNYTIETATTALSNPTRVGYTFTGWTKKYNLEEEDYQRGFIGQYIYTGAPYMSSDSAARSSTYSQPLLLKAGYTYTLSASDGDRVRWRGYNLTTGEYMGQQSLATQYTPSTDCYAIIVYYAGYKNDVTVTTNETSASTTLQSGSTGDITYVANWIQSTYYVKYNANGGSGTMANSTHIYGVASNLTANSFTRAGYTFSGWNTAADGSGASYANSASVSTLTSTVGGIVNLYAEWTQKTYNITGIAFISNANDPTGANYSHVGSATTTAVYGQTLSMNTLFNNQQFLTNCGSNEQLGTGMIVYEKTLDTNNATPTTATGNAITQITIDSTNEDVTTITVYVIFGRTEHTLTINPNGGEYNGSTANTVLETNVSSGRAVRYGSNVNLRDSNSKLPERTGYGFTGWTQATGATGRLNDNYSYFMGGTNDTIVAQWGINYSYLYITDNYVAPRYCSSYVKNDGEDHLRLSNAPVSYYQKYATYIDIMNTVESPGYKFVGWNLSSRNQGAAAHGNRLGWNNGNYSDSGWFGGDSIMSDFAFTQGTGTNPDYYTLSYHPGDINPNYVNNGAQYNTPNYYAFQYPRTSSFDLKSVVGHKYRLVGKIRVNTFVKGSTNAALIVGLDNLKYYNTFTSAASYSATTSGWVSFSQDYTATSTFLFFKTAITNVSGSTDVDVVYDLSDVFVYDITDGSTVYNLTGQYQFGADEDNFTPRFEAINNTVEYELDGGTVATPNPTNYTMESSSFTLNNPTKSGYTFVGWKKTFTFDADDWTYGSIGSNSIPSYTNSLNAGNGSSVYSTAISPFNDTVYYLGAYTVNNNGSQGTVTWGRGSNDVNGYTGSSTGSSINHTATDKYYRISIPDGLDMNYLDDITITTNLAPQQVMETPAGSTGDVLFTAVWIANEYVIEYHVNNATVATDLSIADDIFYTQTVTYDSDTYTITNVPLTTRFNFEGWTTASDSVTKEYDPSQLLINHLTTTDGTIIRLYAIWTYDVKFENSFGTDSDVYRINTANGNSELIADMCDNYVKLKPSINLQSEIYKSDADRSYYPETPGKVFAGWYKTKTAAMNRTEAQAFAKTATVGENTTLYAGWVDIENNLSLVSEDPGYVGSVDEHNTNANINQSEFEMYGLQIRTQDSDTDWEAYGTGISSGNGLRFCIRVSDDLMTKLDSVSSTDTDSRYGFIVTQKALLDNAKTGVPEATAPMISHTQALTSVGNKLAKQYSRRDFLVASTSPTPYRVYTCVVANIATAANISSGRMTADLACRPLIEYIDANGIKRTYYQTDSYQTDSAPDKKKTVGGAYYNNCLNIANYVVACGNEWWSRSKKMYNEFLYGKNANGDAQGYYASARGQSDVNTMYGCNNANAYFARIATYVQDEWVRPEWRVYRFAYKNGQLPWSPNYDSSKDLLTHEILTLD